MQLKKSEKPTPKKEKKITHIHAIAKKEKVKRGKRKEKTTK